MEKKSNLRFKKTATSECYPVLQNKRSEKKKKEKGKNKTRLRKKNKEMICRYI